MRALCIASFNKEYGLNDILKKKKKQKQRYKCQRHEKLSSHERPNGKDKKVLEIASKKSSELDKSTPDFKDTVNSLKKIPIVKSTYTISENNKNKILEYIDKDQQTDYDFKRTEKLSVT